ncbi:glycogen synthase [Ruania zhangjianzhongii]|uniref:glycogen synthase n=1 Tax=Ruania zhangjianzhongii TaxID=2603206 RepID=UPI0011C82FC9|nr:glycogen synthase [Ruania zhangjianzhongii]
MRVDLLTREFPPHVYGGAGVHVAELSAVLARHIDVQVRCFDGPRPGTPNVTGYSEPADLSEANPALRTFGVDLRIAADVAGADLVHSHTWYANLAGHLAGLLNDIPHVLSAHSLEPLRPWKAEQLGGGYALSSWAERTAYEGAARVIAVSAGMRADILHAYPQIDPEKVVVVHNGIDLAAWQRPDEATITRVAAAHGIDPERPAVIFVGRITRQKGLPYLLAAAESLPEDVQLILCAGAPDTPELAAEVSAGVEQLQTRRTGVVWISEMLPREQVTALLAVATVFVCPSIYEPLGIVNLEAMAVGTAVVGSATGGIPEVVDDRTTGLLVPLEQLSDGTGTPLDPDRFVADLAAALTELTSDPARAAAMGAAGRARAEEHFAWDSIAERTLAVYRDVLGQ